jgi:ABC-2 type transport system ATP-binding protein
MTENMEPVIRVTGLGVDYKTLRGAPRPAVDGLDLEVHPGEVVGFIGPNGAGKTTTIKVLMGFLRATRGTASVFGAPAGSLEARRRIGYLPEVALYYPFLTAREALRLYATLADIPSEKREDMISELLAMAGLSGRDREPLRSFSKGMLQRVGIAQAIMGEPELLILDEVTSGLDPVARHDVREILLRFKARGKTVFFSSHELSEVTLLCDRAILVDNGRVLEERHVNELLENTKRHIATVRLPDPPQGLPVGISAVPSEEDTYRFVSEVPADRGQLLDVVSGLRGEVIETHEEAGSLEDYFVRTIGHKIT